MIDLLADPFRSAIGQRALLEVVLVGLACGPLGVWILLFRQVYATESVAHAMLPGLVLAALAGLPLVLGATAGVLAAGALMALAARPLGVGPDTAVAVVIGALFGLGAALAMSPDVPPRLSELLFGDLLGVSATDLAVTAVLAVLVLAGLAAGHRRLALATFDATTAPSLGARPARVGLGLLLGIGIVTVAAVPALGNLLLLALVVAPAATALGLSSRLAVALPLAAALTVLAGLAGVALSFHLDVAAGASVALCAVALFLVSLARPAPGAGPVRTGRLPIDALGS